MGILAALFIALLVSAIFAPGYRRNGSITALFVFFFVLFLAGIAAQYWIVPFGPSYWGVYWFPNVFFVLLLALLFLSPTSYGNRKVTTGTGSVEEASTAAAVISAFVWLILIGLVIAIIAGYYRNSGAYAGTPGSDGQHSPTEVSVEQPN
jgi:hypothetical protein